jgi:hypothetical protein
MAVAVLLAAGASNSQTLLSENFDDVSTLAGAGWSQLNLSAPPGIVASFFQGDQTIFTAQGGNPDAYIAGNYNSAADLGVINNWLITPQFSTATAGTVSFWARSDATVGFSDTLSFGMLAGSSMPTAPVIAAPAVIVATGAWTQYTLNFDASGSGSFGRFALLYTGPQATSSYVGIDTLTVTAVPEPGQWALMTAGLIAMGGWVRLRRAACATSQV